MRCATTSSACWWRMSSRASVTLGLRTLLACAAALSGCADFDRGEHPPAPDAAAMPEAGAEGDAGSADGQAQPGEDAMANETITFSQVHPLLLAGCQDCHRAGGQAANTALLLTGNASADLATTLGFVNTRDPASSRLLTKGTGRNHGGGATWSAGSADAETVLKWIQQGTQP